MRWSAPVDPQWWDVCIAVTPVWVLLSLSRVLFYALERVRYPLLIPPVSADVIQGLVLWPCVVLGCYLTLRIWTRAGLLWATGVAVGTTFVLGALARPAYALATLINTNSEAARHWLRVVDAPGTWSAWLASGVEYGVLYFMSVATAAGFLSFRSLMNERLLRSRVEAAAAHERLRALRTQLNPHFLFNALNSIVSLGETQSPLAQQLITRLSDLLRRTLRASEHEEHELSEELAYLESYLYIQQMRQPSRIEWSVHADLQCTATCVPSLILLPLVENAVTHGLRGATRQVRIEIDVECVHNALVLKVVNTCPVSARQPAAGSGLGLRNVRERLEVMFGARASLIAGRLAPNCFEARISLPLRERPQVTQSTEEAA